MVSTGPPARDRSPAGPANAGGSPAAAPAWAGVAPVTGPPLSAAVICLASSPVPACISLVTCLFAALPAACPYRSSDLPRLGGGAGPEPGPAWLAGLRCLVALHHRDGFFLVVDVGLARDVHADVDDRAAGERPGLAAGVVHTDRRAAVPADVQPLAGEVELAQLGLDVLQLADAAAVDVEVERSEQGPGVSFSLVNSTPRTCLPAGSGASE